MRMPQLPWSSSGPSFGSRYCSQQQQQQYWMVCRWWRQRPSSVVWSRPWWREPCCAYRKPLLHLLLFGANQEERCAKLYLARPATPRWPLYAMDRPAAQSLWKKRIWIVLSDLPWLLCTHSSGCKKIVCKKIGCKKIVLAQPLLSLFERGNRKRVD